MINSFAVMPFAKVTMRAPGSSVVSTTNPGTRRVCNAPTRKSVDAFYKGALNAGGKDNGKPGLRADYGDNYYAAFVVDPDGYRLEAYCSAKS